MYDRPPELSSPVFIESIEHPAAWHPLSEIFPWLDGPAFRELVEDVREHGVREPIVKLDGMILDGRNRYTAARECGVGWFEVEYLGDDPLGYVISTNVKRRHFTDDQRRMVAARIVTLKRGESAKFANGEVSRAGAAKAMQVDEAGIDRARSVVSHGSAELVRAVDTGEASVRAAAEVARLPDEEQREAVRAGRVGEIASAVRERRAEETWRRRVEVMMDRARQADVGGASVPISIGVHYVGRSVKPKAVEAIAKAAGIHVAAFHRAIHLLHADPLQIEQEERETSQVLAGIMAADIEMAMVHHSIAFDESQVDRLTRIWRDGWVSAVLDRDCDGGGHEPHTEEIEAWTDGWQAFAAELERFEGGRGGREAA